MDWTAAQIWLAFFAGLFVRAYQRGGHVVAAQETRSWKGYIEHNAGRLVSRVLSNAAIFYYVVLPLGWITVPPVAFMAGFTFDTLAEDFLNRAKKKFEGVVKRTGNGEAQKPNG